MAPPRYPRVASLKSVEAFKAHAASLPIPLACDNSIDAPGTGPLAQPLEVAGRRVGNRFCVHPMEGWDGTPDGRPSPYTLRRWTHFGRSGAKLIWGGEAFAVRRDGRANPGQLYFHPAHAGATLDALLGTLKKLCRSFSDCTTGPRNGMISGCFPLDDFYKALPEAARVKAVKAAVGLA